MAARAMWKASIEFAGVAVPVKLYARVEDRDVHFRLLHAKDRVPVRQRWFDARSGKEVPHEEARRGVAVEPGVFVVLSESELAGLAPKPSRSIEVTQFIPCGAVDFAWYERPYWLGPDGDLANYGSLVAALSAAKRCGIANWTMRGSRYFGALHVQDAYLTLTTLRSAEEVVAASHLELEPGSPVRAAERKLADQLIEALDGPFDPGALRDAYREKLLAFVKAKSAGRRAKPIRESLPLPRNDLARALQQSLRSAKGRRRAAA